MNKLMIVVVLMLVSSGWPSHAVIASDVPGGEGSVTDKGTEYWALLVGVSENMKKPWNNPENKQMEISTMDLYHQLLQSDHWQPDHIKVLTGENASWLKIYRGLKWLDEMDDEDDICLFYISTHGGQAPDMFPKDEDDGLDEFLQVYDSDRLYFPKIGLTIHIPYRLFYMIDDDINFLLSKLDAQAVCAFFDACYSGGFNDNPSDSIIATKMHLVSSAVPASSPSDWSNEFAQELSGPGRIVIATSAEDKLSQGYGFIHYFLEAFQGYGDTNGDGICTAEEAFAYGAPRCEGFGAREMNFLATPQLFDDYSGELLLTLSQYPPYPTIINSPVSGQINTAYSFTFSADDVEGDMIRYLVDWGDGAEETTEYCSSGEPVSLSHQWSVPGTYNVWFKSEDEHGAAKWSQTGFPDHIAITLTETQSISFVPTKSVLSQVDLEIAVSAVYTEPCPFIVSVRSDLKGEDLTSVAVMPQQIHNHMIPEAPRRTWTTFDFPDIQVIPGKTYYIVCRLESEAFGMWSYAGIGYDHDPDYCDDPYMNGVAFLSKNQGDYWQEFSKIQDFCFVTYSI